MVFAKFLRLETGRFLDKHKLIILLIFYLLAVYFIQSGIDQYKRSLEEIKLFQEFEKTRIDNFQFYDQYGTYGFRLLYIPGPLSALFSGAGIITNNLNAFIDSGERMKIYEPFKGENAFIGYTSIFLNLTGLLFLLGSLLTLFFGLESYRDRDFFLLLINIKGIRKMLFWWVLASRLLLLLGCCLVIILTAWFLYLVNGLIIIVGHLIIYGLVFFLMTAFFLLIGMIIGALINKWSGLVAILSVWLLLTLALPAISGKIVYNRGKSIISVYKMDLKKFKLLMSFEKKAKEQAGQMDRNQTNTEIRRQLFNYLWNNEFKEIMGYEQTMINDMKGVISLHRNLSLIFPTSFFLSVNNEISGRGYDNLISFYEYVYKHKIGFVRYYADKNFFLGEKTVKPYLTGEENIFFAASTLPGNFGFGLVISLFWLVALLALSLWSFNRLLDQQPKTEYENVKEPMPDEIKKNKITLVLTVNPWRLRHLLLILKTENFAFVSVPAPASLPGGVKVNNLFAFFNLPVPEILEPVAGKYCDSLQLDKKALVILEIIKHLPADFLIFNDFLVGLSEEFKNHFKEFLNIHKKDCRIAYFSNSLTATNVCTDVRRFKGENI
jgi:hypothetical protein